jgi:hypothetical protein
MALFVCHYFLFVIAIRPGSYRDGSQSLHRTINVLNEFTANVDACGDSATAGSKDSLGVVLQGVANVLIMAFPPEGGRAVRSYGAGLSHGLVSAAIANARLSEL